MLWIEHQQRDLTPRLRIEYVWNRDNTVASRTEYDYDDYGLQTAVISVSYTYDDRQRLLRETATDVSQQIVYDLNISTTSLATGCGRRTT